VFDFDLTQLVRRHRESAALCTLALKPNPDPRRYGPVVCDSRGFVRSIRRLPRPARGAVSLFTGVQVLDPTLLERLPEGPSDIVAALHAPLLAEGGLIRGVRVRGLWLDLGTPGQYRAAQMALLRTAKGRTKGLSLVAMGARVGSGAHVLRAVVGKGCVIGRGAVVRSSVLWEGARVAEGARISSCIVTAGARVAAGERLTSQIVLAADRVPIA
jgi:mannose-1-phosphate guanylyltransferase